MHTNPTSDQVVISGGEKELTEISIFNALGQEVSEGVEIIQHERNVEVDLSNLREGMYYIKTKSAANKVYKQ